MRNIFTRLTTYLLHVEKLQYNFNFTAIISCHHLLKISFLISIMTKY